MSLCDTCHSPGHCCRGFQLGGDDGKLLTFPVDDPGAPWRYVREQPFPFVPVSAKPTTDQDSGEIRMAVTFTCPKLGTDGRCTIHDSRPALCRRYEAGQDEGCVMYRGPASDR